MIRQAFMSATLCCVTLVNFAVAQPLYLSTFKADVTPPLGTALCDGGVKPGKVVVDPLTVRGVVLQGEGNEPIVLCAIDWVGSGNEGYDAWR